MKIDPNLQSIANAQSDAVQNAKASRAQEANAGNGRIDSRTDRIPCNSSQRICRGAAADRETAANSGRSRGPCFRC